MKKLVLLIVVFLAAGASLAASYEFMNVDLKMRYDVPSRLANSLGLGSWLRNIRSQGTLSFRGYDPFDTSYRWNWRQNRWAESHLDFGAYFQSKDSSTQVSVELSRLEGGGSSGYIGFSRRW